MISNSLKTLLQQKVSNVQVQTMKLLQMNNVCLEDRINQELEVNPLLEPKEPKPEADIPLRDDRTNTNIAKIKKSFDPAFKVDPGSYRATKPSLYENLMEQLGFCHLNSLEQKIGQEIIGNIDVNGYLLRGLPSICDDLFFATNQEIDLSLAQKVLTLIQSFDPPGVGARNLQECLLLQIDRIETITKDTQLSELIIKDKDLFDLFQKNNYIKLKAKLQCSQENLQKAIDFIKSLTPKPSSDNYNLYDNIYITPDFVVFNNNGKVEFNLTRRYNNSLQVSSYYTKMLQELEQKNKDEKTKETITFIKTKLSKAKEFISALNMREDILCNVMANIIKYQYQYFLQGDINLLKPMRLADISQLSGNDISTISRFARQRYCQTHFGLFLIKDLFSNAIEDDNGNKVSTDIIRNIISQSIATEDKSCPLSDDQLVEILKIKGYSLARRTIAKYRNMLNIPVARLRKNTLK